MGNPENLKFRFPFRLERNKTFIHDGQKNKFCFVTFDFSDPMFFSMQICFIDGIFYLSLCDICVIFCKSWKTGKVCGKASQTVKYQAVGTIKLRNHKEMGEILNIKKRNPKKIGDEEDLEI